MNRKKQIAKGKKRLKDLILQTAKEMNMLHVIVKNEITVIKNVRKKLDDDIFGETTIPEKIQDSILEFVM